MAKAKHPFHSQQLLNDELIISIANEIVSCFWLLQNQETSQCRDPSGYLAAVRTHAFPLEHCAW